MRGSGGRSLLLALALAGAASADEVRLEDGEIVFGRVTAREKGRVLVSTTAGDRSFAAGDVAEVIDGTDPRVVVLRPPENVGMSLGGMAEFAWRCRLDGDARRLARAALAGDAENPLVHGLLGERREGDRWVPALAAPFGAAGTVGPRWGEAKRRALTAEGGNAETEAAVRAGLAWLAAHQDDDGRIDADGFDKHCPAASKCDGKGGAHHGERESCPYDGVTTSLALAAWLGSGSTPVSGPFAKHVARALPFCVSELGASASGFDALWSLTFSTQAVADAYAVARDPALREPLARAVAALESAQLRDGGWRYFPADVGDVPTTSAVAVALGTAAEAGIPVDAECAKRVLAFLDARIERDSGRSEYHDGAEGLGYTPTTANAASALAARAFLGGLSSAPLLDKQAAAVTEHKPAWKIEFKDVKGPDGKTVHAQVGWLYPYLWHYATLALFQRGGAGWSAWFGALKSALLKGQRKDGHAAGSWDPLGTYSDSGGRAYVTGLCLLMLEAPYRYPRGR